MRILIPLAFISLIMSCKHDAVISKEEENPETNLPVINAVCFNTEILPVFVTNCAMSGCHDAVSHKSGYDLTTYSGIMSGIVPYKPENGKIIQSMQENDPQEMMPPAGGLSQAKMDLIKRWISEGAQNTTCANACDTLNITYTSHISPLVQTYCLGCHSAATPPARGGVFLDTYTDVKTNTQAGQVICAINHAGCFPMPYQMDKLTNCDIRKFEKWLSIGCPN